MKFRRLSDSEAERRTWVIVDLEHIDQVLVQVLVFLSGENGAVLWQVISSEGEKKRVLIYYRVDENRNPKRNRTSLEILVD